MLERIVSNKLEKETQGDSFFFVIVAEISEVLLRGF